MKVILLLIFEFFKTGLFAVGGGLATIPFLEEMSIKYGWFTLEMLTTMIAVSEGTPGPIGIKMATYVGYMVAGITGGILTTIALVTPSIIVIIIIAKMLEKFKNSKLVDNLFYGLKPAVVGLILSACSSIFIMTLFSDSVSSSSLSLNLINILLYIGLLTIYIKKKVHPIILIILCGLLGICLRL